MERMCSLCFLTRGAWQHRTQKLGFISSLTFSISQNCFIEKDENRLKFLFAGNIKLKYFAKKYFICIIKTSVAGTSFALSVRRNCSGGGLVSTFSAASPYHLKLNQPFFFQIIHMGE